MSHIVLLTLEQTKKIIRFWVDLVTRKVRWSQDKIAKHFATEFKWSISHHTIRNILRDRNRILTETNGENYLYEYSFVVVFFLQFIIIVNDKMYFYFAMLLCHLRNKQHIEPEQAGSNLIWRCRSTKTAVPKYNASRSSRNTR